MTEFYLWLGFEEASETDSLMSGGEGLTGRLSGSGSHTDVTPAGLTPSPATQDRLFSSVKSQAGCSST